MKRCVLNLADFLKLGHEQYSLNETVRWYKTHVSGSVFFPVTRARGSQQSKTQFHKTPGNAQAKHSLYRCSAVAHSFETAQLSRNKYLEYLTPNINGPNATGRIEFIVIKIEN